MQVQRCTETLAKQCRARPVSGEKEGEYRQYSTDEQFRQTGYSALRQAQGVPSRRGGVGRMQLDVHKGLPGRRRERGVSRLSWGSIMKLTLVLLLFAIGMTHVARGQIGTGGIVAINGIDMRYRTHGTGEPLLLLHGFLGSGDTWATILGDLDRLGRDYRASCKTPELVTPHSRTEQMFGLQRSTACSGPRPGVRATTSAVDATPCSPLTIVRPSPAALTGAVLA